MNLEDMYSNLPRSLKAEVLVRTKVEDDEDVLKERQNLVTTMKPAQLAQFNSLADFPMPARLERVFKGGDKPKAPKRNKSKDMEEKRK